MPTGFLGGFAEGEKDQRTREAHQVNTQSKILDMRIKAAEAQNKAAEAPLKQRKMEAEVTRTEQVNEEFMEGKGSRKVARDAETTKNKRFIDTAEERHALEDTKRNAALKKAALDLKSQELSGVARIAGEMAASPEGYAEGYRMLTQDEEGRKLMASQGLTSTYSPENVRNLRRIRSYVDNDKKHRQSVEIKTAQAAAKSAAKAQEIRLKQRLKMEGIPGSKQTDAAITDISTMVQGVVNLRLPGLMPLEDAENYASVMNSLDNIALQMYMNYFSGANKKQLNNPAKAYDDIKKALISGIVAIPGKDADGEPTGEIAGFKMRDPRIDPPTVPEKKLKPGFIMSVKPSFN